MIEPSIDPCSWPARRRPLMIALTTAWMEPEAIIIAAAMAKDVTPRS
jgi:hypothetical protein